MKYDWLNEFCLGLLGTREDYKAEWEATRYLVDDKMFLMVGENKKKQEIITLKLPPEVGHLMRQEYEEVVPGYYMNKEHWNSIDANGSVSDEMLMGMIRQSHKLILEGLTKKRQKELLAGQENEH